MDTREKKSEDTGTEADKHERSPLITDSDEAAAATTDARSVPLPSLVLYVRTVAGRHLIHLLGFKKGTAAKMSFFETLGKQFTPQKLAFNIIFWGAHWAIFAYGWWKQLTDTRLAPLNTNLTFSVWISRGAGLVLSVDGMIILLPVCRTIMRWIRPKIRFLPLDENIWFHRQVAYAMLLFSAIHTAGHYINFFNIEKLQIRPQTAVQIHYTQPGGVTGHMMLLCMLLIYTTAHHRIRQQSFETFWYTHHLFIPFMLGLYTHTVGCFIRDTVEPVSPFAGNDFWDHCIGYEGWRWELWTGGFYFIERLYREIRARRETKITRVVRHPFDVVEIQFSKPSFRYKAGQWLFLQVPSVSKYQWHPFTITSCPYDPYVSMHFHPPL